MRIPRIYCSQPLISGQVMVLDEDAAHHVSRVLRMVTGQPLSLFDGSNQAFNASISHIDKKQVWVQIQQGKLENRESPLHLHLGQVISRGEKMEFTIQKSVELGVNEITPLFSQRCGIQPDEARMTKKIQQWRKIAIAASEQCGRNCIAQIHPAQTLESWCGRQENRLKLNLHPRASTSIRELSAPQAGISLIIGPEGGLSETEIAMTTRHQFTDILLGPRILRTETTALTAISALQVCFGDLG